MPQSSLHSQLHRLDGASYKAYQDLKGSHEFPDFTLSFDRIQGDPFAAPSQCRVQIPQSVAQFPVALFNNAVKSIALRDYLIRQFDRACQALQHKRGSGSSGLIRIVQPSQIILDRSAVLIDEQYLEVRFVVGLPAFGRRIAGQQAIELLCEDLPRIVDRALIYPHLNADNLQTHLHTAEDAHALREQLAEHQLVAFLAEGSILPRRSGIDDRPLLDRPIALQVPDSLKIELPVPHRGSIVGLGIPQGITLLVGGGYHGKSTLLRAIERGIYNHIPGDGREFVVTRPNAVKIRAEDGRSVHQVDISPFINHLLRGQSTRQFCTPNASGSTSQAANVIEAIAAGSDLLLLDEDTCATNFMIRDRRMQALIAKDREPITPFLDRVRQLYTEHGISTILVMGGCGDYLDVADTVIALHDFYPQDVTPQARAIAQTYPSDRQPEGGKTFGSKPDRLLPADFLRQTGLHAQAKLKVRDRQTLSLDRQTIDLSGLEHLIEPAQLQAIALALTQLASHDTDRSHLHDRLTHLMDQLEKQSWHALSRFPRGDLAQFRHLELAAVLNRLRPCDFDR